MADAQLRQVGGRGSAAAQRSRRSGRGLGRCARTLLAACCLLHAPGAALKHALPPYLPPSPLQWFDSIDADRSGQLNAKEIQSALALGNLNFSQSEVRRRGASGAAAQAVHGCTAVQGTAVTRGGRTAARFCSHAAGGACASAASELHIHPACMRAPCLWRQAQAVETRPLAPSPPPFTKTFMLPLAAAQCDAMVRAFDQNSTRTLGYDEFMRLHNFLVNVSEPATVIKS